MFQSTNQNILWLAGLALSTWRCGFWNHFMGRSWGIEVHDQEYYMYSPVDTGKKTKGIHNCLPSNCRKLLHTCLNLNNRSCVKLCCRACLPEP